MRLYEQAVANQVGSLNGTGFAPGPSLSTVAEGMHRFDEAVSATARVREIPAPAAARRPSGTGVRGRSRRVRRDYMIRLLVAKNGRAVEVDARTAREPSRFRQPGGDAEIGCGVTPRMPSFIHSRPTLQELADKTVRRPGHYRAIATPREHGLVLAWAPAAGTPVVSRESLVAAPIPRNRARLGEGDACVIGNTIRGTKDRREAGVDCCLWEESDREHGIPSIARVTGLAAALGVGIVGRGRSPSEGSSLRRMQSQPPVRGISGGPRGAGDRVREEVTVA